MRTFAGIVIGAVVGLAALYVPVQLADCGAGASNLCGLRAALFAPVGAVVGGVIGGVVGARLEARRQRQKTQTK